MNMIIVKAKAKKRIAKAKKEWFRNFSDLYSFKRTKLLRPDTRSALLAKSICIFWDAGLGKSKSMHQAHSEYKQAIGRINRTPITTYRRIITA